MANDNPKDTQDNKSFLQGLSTQSFIAIVLVVAMIALTFAMLFVKAPDSDVFKMLSGGLMTVGFATIIGFYFGSSAGSKAKDDTIQNIAAASTGTGNGTATAAPPAPAAPATGGTP